jgi:hypothetical protein
LLPTRIGPLAEDVEPGVLGGVVAHAMSETAMTAATRTRTASVQLLRIG